MLKVIFFKKKRKRKLTFNTQSHKLFIFLFQFGVWKSLNKQ